MSSNLSGENVLPAGSIPYAPYGLPGFTGSFEAALVNTDLQQAPFLACW